MPQFTQFKVTASSVFFRSGSVTLRGLREAWPETLPASLDVVARDEDGNEIDLPTGPAPRVRETVSPEVAAAIELVKSHQAAQRAARENALTPEQREKRDARKAAKAEAKQAAKEAEASAVRAARIKRPA